MRTVICSTLTAALLIACGATDPSDTESTGDSTLGSTTQEIRDATRVDDDAMLEMVQVRTSRGQCSGMVIASDTILTAAHCFCDEREVGTPSCIRDADVTFRSPKSWLGTRVLHGTGRTQPKYNPSWSEGQYEHDVATIKLDGVAPYWVKPVELATGYLPTSTIIRVAGYGHTGSNCSGDAGTLNYDTTDIDGYEDGHDIVRFDQKVWCHGDSGGGVFDAEGRLRGVISMETPYSQKAVTTGSEYDWIKGGMCRSNALTKSSCTSQGVTCNCTGRKDIFWQNANGQVGIWTMNGSNATAQYGLGTVYSDWQVQGSGDFNGDGTADLLWRHNTGQVAIWYVKNGSNSGQSYPGGTDAGLTWKIQTTADFDGDGRSDILWRHNSGQLAIWFQGDATRAAYPGWNNQPAPVEAYWRVKGAGDFNGDRYADIVWENEQGQVSIWLMQGGTRIGEFSPGVVSTTTQLVGIGDFDGDLKADLLWRGDDGILYPWFAGVWSTDAIRYRNDQTSGDWSWTVQGVGDFDHDGRDDILWRHTSGQLAIWLVQGARFNGDIYPPLVDNSWKIKTLLSASGF